MDLYEQDTTSGITETGIWYDSERSKKELEEFTLHKYLYLFYRSLKTMSFIH